MQDTIDPETVARNMYESELLYLRMVFWGTRPLCEALTSVMFESLHSRGLMHRTGDLTPLGRRVATVAV
jgi:hypothetical protein